MRTPSYFGWYLAIPLLMTARFLSALARRGIVGGTDTLTAAQWRELTRRCISSGRQTRARIVISSGCVSVEFFLDRETRSLYQAKLSSEHAITEQKAMSTCPRFYLVT